jgi:hypothetical protein
MGPVVTAVLDDTCGNLVQIMGLTTTTAEERTTGKCRQTTSGPTAPG